MTSISTIYPDGFGKWDQKFGWKVAKLDFHYETSHRHRFARVPVYVDLIKPLVSKPFWTSEGGLYPFNPVRLLEVIESSEGSSHKKVNSVLDETKFFLWKQQILLTVRSYRLECLLTDALKPAPETITGDNGEFVSAKSTTVVCITVQQLFANRSTMVAIHLHYKLQSLKKGNDNMRTYLTRVKEVYDALASCGSTVSHVGHVSSILKGLTREYQPFMAVITTMKETLSLDSLYTVLLVVEAQLADFDEQVDLLPMSSNLAQHHEGHNSVEVDRNDSKVTWSSSVYISGGRGRARARIQCQLCGKLGHLVDRCWHHFDEDYMMLSRTDQAQANVISKATDQWVVTSGTTHHITPDAANVSNLNEFRGSGNLTVGNGVSLNIHNIGSTVVASSSKTFLLNELLHVPWITKNLLSVSKLARDNAAYLEFHAERCYVRDEASKEILCKVKRRRVVYIFIWLNNTSIFLPYTSEQNGVMECKHRHIVELNLVLLAQASLPIRYWSYAVNHKLAFISQSCTYLGFSPQHKGYQCLASDDKTMSCSRHHLSGVQSQNIPIVTDVRNWPHNIAPNEKNTPHVAEKVTTEATTDTYVNDDVNPIVPLSLASVDGHAESGGGADTTACSRLPSNTLLQNLHPMLTRSKKHYSLLAGEKLFKLNMLHFRRTTRGCWLSYQQVEFQLAASGCFNSNATQMVLFNDIRHVVTNGWELRHVDINNAFLNGDLDEDVSCSNHPASRADPSLFLSKRDDGDLYLLMYVDDIVITGLSSSAIQEVVQLLSNMFSLKDLGLLSFFLGIEVHRAHGSVMLSQRKFVLELLESWNERSCYVHYTNDLAYSVGKVAQYMHPRRETHMLAVKRILRYLAGTVDYGMLFQSVDAGLTISAFADADWGANVDDRISISGYRVFVGRCLVTWSSKKKKSVSRSTMEADGNECQFSLSCTVKTHRFGLHFAREKVAARQIQVNYIPAAHQIVDGFTKPLARVAFEDFRAEYVLYLFLRTNKKAGTSRENVRLLECAVMSNVSCNVYICISLLPMTSNQLKIKSFPGMTKWALIWTFMAVDCGGETVALTTSDATEKTGGYYYSYENCATGNQDRPISGIISMNGEVKNPTGNPDNLMETEDDNQITHSTSTIHDRITATHKINKGKVLEGKPKLSSLDLGHHRVVTFDVNQSHTDPKGLTASTLPSTKRKLTVGIPTSISCGGHSFPKILKEYTTEHKPHMVTFLETRISGKMTCRVMKKFGIWLLWNRPLLVEVVALTPSWSKHPQFSLVWDNWAPNGNLINSLHDFSNVLIKWNMEVYGNSFKEKCKIKNKLANAQAKLECNPTDHIISKELDLRTKLEDGPRRAILSETQRLKALVSDEEIKDALFDMNPIKALSKDDLYAIFFQSQWSIVGSSIKHSLFHGSWSLGAIYLARGSPPLSHLFFVDDVVLFYQASLNQAKLLGAILDRFSRFSWHKVNSQKTRVFFSTNVDEAEAVALCNLVGFQLSGQTVEISRGVYDKLEQISWRFIWGGSRYASKTPLVNWDSCCQPLCCGGLGLHPLKAQNYSFLVKMGFNFLIRLEALRAKIMRAKDSRSTKFWFDSWIPSSNPLVDELVPSQIPNPHAKEWCLPPMTWGKISLCDVGVVPECAQSRRPSSLYTKTSLRVMSRGKDATSASMIDVLFVVMTLKQSLMCSGTATMLVVDAGRRSRGAGSGAEVIIVITVLQFHVGMVIIVGSRKHDEFFTGMSIHYLLRWLTQCDADPTPYVMDLSEMKMFDPPHYVMKSNEKLVLFQLLMRWKQAKVEQVLLIMNFFSLIG
ncbi:hypothetical protein F3Y22_tig00000910pilonHSYRG00040 [Hibiscus syriacus]|uniref:Uncharacterized protein n=1 Tax=Hibiscus syriacus TaxID=106335 RepID=A0A6A3CZW3_HIBSY|nr:hypothetical protein F3Y22_tig00000910pilonHSYRG00040 [Hibiscus syriacus]